MPLFQRLPPAVGEPPIPAVEGAPEELAPVVNEEQNEEGVAPPQAPEVVLPNAGEVVENNVLPNAPPVPHVFIGIPALFGIEVRDDLRGLPRADRVVWHARNRNNLIQIQGLNNNNNNRDNIPNDIPPHLGEAGLLDGQFELTPKRFLLVCAFNALVIILVVAFPVFIGRIVIQISGLHEPVSIQLRSYFDHILSKYFTMIVNESVNNNSNNNNNATNTNIYHASPEHFLLNIPEELLWRKIYSYVESIIGTSVLFTTGILTAISYFFWANRTPRDFMIRIFVTQVQNIHTILIKWLKISIVLCLEGCILPQLVGWLIDIVTIKAFEITVKERFEMCHRNAIACALIHWAVGFLFMMHISTIAIELRELIKKDILVGVLPESPTMIDIEEPVLELLSMKSVSELTRRILLSTCFYVPGVLVAFLFPCRFGHYLCPFSHPLKLRFDEMVLDVQLPLELLIFHVLVPFVLERVRHRVVIQHFLHQFLLHACHILQLSELLLEPIPFGLVRNNNNNIVIHDDARLMAPPEVMEQPIVVGGVEGVGNVRHEDHALNSVPADGTENDTNDVDEMDANVWVEVGSRDDLLQDVHPEHDDSLDSHEAEENVLDGDEWRDRNSDGEVSENDSSDDGEGEEYANEGGNEIESVGVAAVPYRGNAIQSSCLQWVGAGSIALRCLVLLLAGLCVMTFLYSWAIHLPLAVGREVLALLT